MRNLLKYLHGYRRQAILAPLFKLLEACFELLVPLVMADIIDKGIANGDPGYVYAHGLLLVGMGLVGLLSAITAQYFSAQAATGFGTRLRDDLFRHIMSMSRQDTDMLGQATLVTRVINDTNQIQSGVNMFFRLVLRSPMVVFGALLMACLISPRQGLLFGAVILVLAIIVTVIMNRSVVLFKGMQQRLDAITLKTDENLEGVRVIRAFRRQQAERDGFRQASDLLVADQLRSGRVSALMNPLTYAIINLGLVAVLRLGAIDVNTGALTQGQVVALVNYMSQLLVELVKLANLIILLSKAIACARRVDDVLATNDALANGSMDLDAGPLSLSFSHVSFTYPAASRPALQDICMDVAPGQTIGIIGGTGSGKTTLADLLLRFYDVSTGRLTIDGHDIRDYDIARLRRRVGIVQQGSRLFAGSIADNLRWGDQTADESQLQAAVATAQAQDVVSAKPDHLEAAVEQDGRNFSGGQKQRLSIARTLVRNPGLLILDDASSALDFATDAALRRALRADRTEATVLLISQRVSTIRHADRIAVLDDGRLAGFGTHEQLLAGCPLYKEICLSQLSAKEVAAA